MESDDNLVELSRMELQELCIAIQEHLGESDYDRYTAGELSWGEFQASYSVLSRWAVDSQRILNSIEDMR